MQGGVQGLGRLPLKIGEHVRVRVERDLSGRVPEPLRHHLTWTPAESASVWRRSWNRTPRKPTRSAIARNRLLTRYSGMIEPSGEGEDEVQITVRGPEFMCHVLAAGARALLAFLRLHVLRHR